MDPVRALNALRAGNDRFVDGRPERRRALTIADRATLAGGQRPMAAVIACADSRTAPEIVFDQALGALFVVRVAGNVVGPTQLESVAFAVSELQTRLVMVLGHSACGAVRAAYDHAAAPDAGAHPLNTLTEMIGPAIEIAATGGGDADAVVHRAVRANIGRGVETLRRADLLAPFTSDGLRIVGAAYDLVTGVIDVFDDGTS